MRRTLLIILLILMINPSLAQISFDKPDLDTEIFEPPQLQNEKLNSTINLSYHDTSISDILLMLSKFGDFNVILPEKYNKRITVKLSNQRIIDAIEDITELSGLNYKFKGNSLLISGNDIQGQSFASVPILYYQAPDIVNALNNTLFAQLAIGQDPNRNNAHASVDPTKNSIIILGDEEQILAAKTFINKIDIPQTVKIYNPSFIELDDAMKLVDIEFNRDHHIKIKRYEGASFIVKGLEPEVKAAIDLIRSHDKIPEPIDLIVEIYAVKQNQSEIFSVVNNLIQDSALSFNSEIINSDAYTSLFKLSDKIYTNKIQITLNKPTNLLGIDFDGQRDFIDPSKYELKVFGHKFKAVDSSDQIIKMLNKEDLKINPEIKNLIDDKHDQLVLFLIKAA